MPMKGVSNHLWRLKKLAGREVAKAIDEANIEFGKDIVSEAGEPKISDRNELEGRAREIAVKHLNKAVKNSGKREPHD